MIEGVDRVGERERMGGWVIEGVDRVGERMGDRVDGGEVREDVLIGYIDSMC